MGVLLHLPQRLLHLRLALLHVPQLLLQLLHHCLLLLHMAHGRMHVTDPLPVGGRWTVLQGQRNASLHKPTCTRGPGSLAHHTNTLVVRDGAEALLLRRPGLLPGFGEFYPQALLLGPLIQQSPYAAQSLQKRHTV